VYVRNCHVDNTHDLDDDHDDDENDDVELSSKEEDGMVNDNESRCRPNNYG
jgi:hypothetical protein